MPDLFLDADGVLADFDSGARRLLGMLPRQYEERHGKKQFWRRLAAADGFYANLPLLPDAMQLFDAVEHLRPTILTGLPLGRWAAPQKVAWAARHFPGTPIITCMARDKYRYMQPGDVLVDDSLTHREVWENAGGVFIHHESAAQSIARLARHFPSVQG